MSTARLPKNDGGAVPGDSVVGDLMRIRRLRELAASADGEGRAGDAADLREIADEYDALLHAAARLIRSDGIRLDLSDDPSPQMTEQSSLCRGTSG